MDVPTTSIKVLVPKGISRDQLLEFARKTIREQLMLKHFKIVTISPSHSKSEQEGEATFRMTFSTLWTN